MAPKMPTDLDLLNVVYASLYDKFVNFSETEKTRSSKIWVPVDIGELADEFNTDPDIIFGRLYYHLNDKYSHKNQDGSKTEFFALRIGSDHHCVNFPFLTSILASLKEDHRKYIVATAIAGLSLVISIISIIIAVMM